MVESRRVGSRSKKSSPPIFSHEFIIQNHGDIMSVIVLGIVGGLIFKGTAKFTSIFVVPQYNQTESLLPQSATTSLYRTGPLDIAATVFYSIVWITVHAVLQEYILDKLQRKLHLSKTKMSKFAESGQLFVFSLASMVYAGYILHDLQIHSDITKLWVGYPDSHRYLSFHLKLFFILQIAYWIHQFPEFYFQKIRKDDMQPRTVYTLIFLFFTVAAYILNFNRLALTLLLLEYISQSIFHLTRLFHFAEKWSAAKNGFKLWNTVFLLVRLTSMVTTVLTLWYGLRSYETPFVDLPNGNFNTTFIRLNSMICVVALQLYMLWNFSIFHVRRYREKHDRTKHQKSTRVGAKKKKGLVNEKPQQNGYHPKKKAN